MPPASTNAFSNAIAFLNISTVNGHFVDVSIIVRIFMYASLTSGDIASSVRSSLVGRFGKNISKTASVDVIGTFLSTIFLMVARATSPDALAAPTLTRLFAGHMSGFFSGSKSVLVMKPCSRLSIPRSTAS